MSNLKELIKSLDEGGVSEENEIEVYADSIKQALALASAEFNVDLTMLDYDVIEKGTKGFMGFGRQPFKVIVRPLTAEKEFGDLNALDSKLTSSALHINTSVIPENMPGTFKIRTTKTGVWFKVSPPRGKGEPAKLQDIAAKFDMLRIKNYDQELVKKIAKNKTGEYIRVGEWVPNIDNDGSLRVELSDDEMSAYVRFQPPRFSGRHMELDDVLIALKHMNIISGIDEKKINAYLEEMNYSSPLLAAQGSKPQHGKDAYIEYKVRLSSEINFNVTDDQIDFKELNLIENVVAGQILAVKIPAEKGIPGRTVTNRVLPAKSGKDCSIIFGEGTILSDDKTELTAERNGQVVMKGNKITVDEVMIVSGDVDNKSGNIVMLGSVMVTGNVIDNFTIKASGNIEVRGSVQKAFLEAEGDIIVRGGINGRDEAKIETTNGSIYARFVRSAHLVAEKNVFIGEELLHSRVDAGKVIFSNGRRAHIVGGILRAGDEVNAKEIGADSYVKTEIRVGMNPKVLQQMQDLESGMANLIDELEKIEKDLHTLDQRQRAGKITAEQKEMIQTLKGRKEKLTERKTEIKFSIDELNEYLNMIEQKGRVCAEKNLFPGVEIYIKDKKLKVNDPYSNVLITLERGEWKFGKYQPPAGVDAQLSAFARKRR
ncbi:MAG: FapA family protein [Spirochaetes bacterium]|nr:FapA family protein [Spirochaetota bacterium]